MRLVRPGTATKEVAPGEFEVDLSSPGSIRELHQLLPGKAGHRVAGVLNCLALGEPFRVSSGDELTAAQTLCTWGLNFIKEMLDDLCSSPLPGGAWLINVTPLGGKFGLEGDRPVLAAAGMPGMIKTLAREHSVLRVKNLDVDPTLAAEELAPRLVREGALDGPPEEESRRRGVEIGLTRGGRWCLELRSAPLPVKRGPLPLGPESVVLIAGGAQGVTASVTKALAAEARCHLVVVGLSAMPALEPAELAGLERTELRQLLIAKARAAGKTVVPGDVERQINRVLKDRQIRATLQACEAVGARIEYHQMDVRDDERFGALIDDVYGRLGRIDGVVHGVGVIEDRLLAEKSPESFSRVFATKVSSALTLARKLRPEGLKFVTFFSSVTARFGNPGQADYASANEYLNKLACELGRRWPARVVSINWGPWEGGMVAEPTRDLRGMYARIGIELISLADGAEACLAELCQGPGQDADVLIARTVGRMVEMSSDRW